jgi:acetolactate synthase I/II/III large subunit
LRARRSPASAPTIRSHEADASFKKANRMKSKQPTVAEHYLAQLADRGVEYLFGNAGTDFAPIIEAYAEAAQSGGTVPKPMIATHENVAVSMAHGYAMLARKVPAVMVHVSVGTANMICPAMNAARENVPILLTAGRSPITEKGLPGSRDGYIHWAQEMFDQNAMLREIVKWDYELRNPEQVEAVVDRALAIAQTEPWGPVYLSLPREVIAMPAAQAAPAPLRMQAASAPAPDPAAIRAAAEMIAQAKNPFIVSSNAGRDPAAFTALAEFAERFAIPVAQHRPRYLSLPSSHPMNLGYDAKPLFEHGDLALVIESDVPWIPEEGEPKPDCKAIQCGLDPLHSYIPIRSFGCDLGITAMPAAALRALTDALAGKLEQADIEKRRTRVANMRAALQKNWAAARDAGQRKMPLNFAWVSHCIGQAKPDNAIVVNEYTLQLEHCAFEQPDSYFGSSSASGLGWGGGAALGAKIAAPERPVIAVLGDGAYLFSNPAAVHHAAAHHELPVLFIVMNNSKWNAVERFTLAMYPNGAASKSNAAPFIQLENMPAFEKICEAAGGYGERVEDPEVLPKALERALAVVQNEKRHALLNVMCG